MILTCTYTRFSFIMFIGEAYTSEVSESESQSCPTLCDSMDYIVHGILQGRILEWVAFPFSRNLPNSGIQPGSPTLQADSLPVEPQGKH